MTQGIVNFTFGYKPAFRLLVALYSLRKYYDGEIALMFQKDDEACKKLEPIVKDKFNTNVVWIDVQARKNPRSIFKMESLKNSPFDKTIMVDADMLFVNRFDEIFHFLDRYDFAMSPFSDWTVNHKNCKHHMEYLRERVFRPQILDLVMTQNKPYFNAGFFGVNKNAFMEGFVNLWEAWTDKGLDNFMCDETVLNVMQWLPEYENHRLVLPQQYNASYNYMTVPLESTKIIHFHGNGHRKMKYKSTKVWWVYVLDMFKEHPDLKTWMNTDQFAVQVMDHVNHDINFAEEFRTIKESI